MDPQLRPVRVLRVEHVHQRSLARDAAAVGAHIVIAQPCVLGDECHLGRAGRAVPLIAPSFHGLAPVPVQVIGLGTHSVKYIAYCHFYHRRVGARALDSLRDHAREVVNNDAKTRPMAAFKLRRATVRLRFMYWLRN